jgi:uracil-DNA glycosylase family 4
MQRARHVPAAPQAGFRFTRGIPVAIMRNMDALTALSLQLDWGADEALDDSPQNRFAAPTEAPRPAAAELPARSPVRPTSRPDTPPAVATPEAPFPVATPVQLAEQVARAAGTIDALRAALAAFEGCPLRQTATNLVFADGNPAAGLVFIGEAPGAEEDREGRPFCGPSGKFLDRMLASIGLDRSQYLITNIIPWRPPGNRNPTDTEVLVCLPFLLRHLALLRPRRLVLLGKMAASSLTGSTQGIRRMRGTWTNIAIPGLPESVPALPMLHPAYLLRTPGAKREAWADLLALRRALDAD